MNFLYARVEVMQRQGVGSSPKGGSQLVFVQHNSGLGGKV